MQETTDIDRSFLATLLPELAAIRRDIHAHPELCFEEIRTADLVAQKLTDQNKWNVIVDNRPGAGGNLGVDAAAKSAPDGYTLVMGQTSNLAINPTLYELYMDRCDALQANPPAEDWDGVYTHTSK